MLGSTNASMRTVPTASKKLGLSGLVIESLRLPLFEDELRKSVRKEEFFVVAGCKDVADDGIALEEKLRRPPSGGGSLGLVLLRLR